MKKITIVLLIFQVAALVQPCVAFNKVDQQQQFEDSLNFQMVEGQMKELENGFLSSNHLKSGIIDLNLPDSIMLYAFKTSGDSVLNERTLFKYDNAGRINTELQYRWNPSLNRWLNFKYENTYDRSGKITLKKYNGWYIRAFVGDVNINGVHYKDTTIAFPYSMAYPYQYNKFGKPLRLWRFTFDQDDTPVGTFYDCYYDAVGNTTSVEIGLPGQPSYLEEYTYDSEKKLVTVTQSRFSEYNYIALWFCYSKIKYDYSYNPDGGVKSISSSYFSYKANQWKDVARADYSYKDNGILDSRLYFILDSTRNELLQANKTDYKYNKKDKIQLREDFAWNKTSGLWEIRKKQYYFYKNSDTKAKLFESGLANEMPFSIFPNPAKNMLWIKNTGNEASTIHIYNINRQCVQTDRIKTGMNAINLSALPKGIYILKIPHVNELKSYKLVVE